ncbi:MAG: GntR family transcriptional regulator [Clostridiaceae bacterium]|nr:GntR family transcriptional regulator [Clostridiaceae bacterium]
MIADERNDVPRKSKSDIAYEYIKKGIIEKKFFPGNQIIEEDIVKATGVSRTSVRKALNLLQYEGILEGKTTRGIIVAKHSVEDIISTFRIREVLETNAFELAVKNIDDEAIQKMKEYNEGLRKVSRNFNIIDFVKYNKDFHWVIATATKDKYYMKYLNEIYNNIAVYLLFYNSTVDDKRSIGYHNTIIEALIEGDVEKGKAAIIADNYCGIEDLAIK